MIQKQMVVNTGIVMRELRKIVDESKIVGCDDKLWPMPDKIGRQELEIVIGDTHINFTVLCLIMLFFNF